MPSKLNQGFFSINFSSVLDLVNQQSLFYKLKSMGIGGPILNIFKDFLTNRQQHALFNGNFSQFKPIVSGVPQGINLGPLLLILYTTDMLNGEVASPSDCLNGAIP